MKDLFVIAESVKGCVFAQIAYECKVTMPKAFGEVRKYNYTNVQLGYSYGNACNNRGAVDFVPDSLPWGEWELVNKVIKHKGKRYLRFYANKNARPITEYWVNGIPATEEQIAQIKAKENAKSAKQSAHGLTENQVVARCVAFENVLSLTVNGETYTRKDSEKLGA